MRVAELAAGLLRQQIAVWEQALFRNLPVSVKADNPPHLAVYT